MNQLFNVAKTNPPTSLSDKYIVPPFSVFNTHQPYWRIRNKMWNDMGIGGTNGRITSNNGLTYDNRRMDKYGGKSNNTNGTSAFSPVLCEVIYKWFIAGGKKVFDPFSGGITRGMVAAMLGLDYIGVDINPLQVSSNYDNKGVLEQKYNIPGTCEWLLNDVIKYRTQDKADLIFTCPPYCNLEKYTDDPDDLSNCPTYSSFLDKYTQIIELCYNLLEDDSFMVWVVSDVRDKQTTEYIGLVADTIKIAQRGGFKFYNEIILYNDTGNLAIVSGDYLNKARKVGRQHQNVLVFYKGDISHISEKFGPLI